MGDERRGVYQKYTVARTDGSSEPGKKHAGCRYFVLDVGHDPHARPALAAYAASCAAAYPLLAADLRDLLARSAAAPLVLARFETPRDMVPDLPFDARCSACHSLNTGRSPTGDWCNACGLAAPGYACPRCGRDGVNEWHLTAPIGGVLCHLEPSGQSVVNGGPVT